MRARLRFACLLTMTKDKNTAPTKGAPAKSDAPAPLTERERMLLDRVEQLEKRVAELEAKQPAGAAQPAPKEPSESRATAAGVSATTPATAATVAQPKPAEAAQLAAHQARVRPWGRCPLRRNQPAVGRARRR